MKKQLTKRLLSALLTLSLILCLLPATVQAADKTIIDSVSVEFNPERLPKAGVDVTIVGDELLSDDSGRPYTIGKGTWYSDIPNGYDNDVVRHFYEINDSNESMGYSFEAGKTYLYSFGCSLKSEFKDTHSFLPRAEDDRGKFTISNLPSSSYSVIAVESHYDYFRAYVAFTVDGVCPYEDITRVSAKWDSFFVYPPAANRQASYMVFDYGNFSVACKWDGDFTTSAYGGSFFKAGEHYTHTATLTARDGYRFASDVEFWFLYGEPDSMKLSDDRKQLTLVYEYDVDDVVSVDTVEFANSMGQSLLPSRSYGLTDCQQLNIVSDDYYEVSCSGWQDEHGNAKTGISSGDILTITEIVRIRNTNTHKFPKDVTGVITGLPEDSYTVQTNWIDEGTVKLTFVFAEGYTREVGKTAEEPVQCSSFFGLKWALENPDLRYIEMNGCEENLPLIRKEADSQEERIEAINVSTNKYLTLHGETCFTALEVDETAYLFYKNLICVPEGSMLQLSGDGSLTYRGYHPEADNAPLIVRGGRLTVDGVTVTASLTKGGAYAPAIGNIGGQVTIKGGVFNGDNDSSFEGAAVMVLGGTTVIENGRFETFGSGINYGLRILSQNSKVSIDRGQFYSNGIWMPDDSIDLSRYVDANHTVQLGGQEYAPDEVYQSQIDSSYIVPMKINRIIDRAELKLAIPVAGETVDTAPQLSEGLQRVSVKWYANGSAIAMASGGKFSQGSTYRAVITVQADTQSLYKLAKPSAFIGRINGKSATVTATADGYALSYDFGQCKNALTSLYFTGLTMPREYDLPDYSVVADTDSEGKVSVSKVFWYEDGVEMATDARFRENHAYTMKLRVIAGTNYIFNVDADGEPMMDGYIDDILAYTEKYEDYAGTKYAFVVVNFGYMADTVIDEISLRTELPVAGEKPHYEVYSDGQYHVDRNKYGYDEEYVGPNAGHRSYYKVGGVSWYDVTDSSYVYENEFFIPGHTYELYVNVVPDSGKEFLFKSVPFGDDLLVAASVNGEKAEARELGNEGLREQGITYRFVCEPGTVRTVEITDLSAPVAGRNPDYTMTMVGLTYQPKADFGTNNSGIEWYTAAGDLMQPTDTFVEGEKYMVRLRIEPIEIDGAKMCKFYNGTAVSLNGTTVQEKGDNLINRTTNRVELFYYYGATPADIGAPENGWFKYDGKWYYYENSTMVKNAWRQDSVGWVYLGEDGAMLTNSWCRDSKGWCYVGADGYAVTNCWKKDSVGWVYLDANGSMVYNKWVKDSKGWCYVGADGYMVYNKWVKDSVGWCYVGADGYMVYNKWVKDSVGWCYVGADGYMVYNKWVADSKGWCYVGADGYMVTNGWAKDSIGWYWMGADGYAIKNTSKTIGGKTYYFNASGLCTNP